MIYSCSFQRNPNLSLDSLARAALVPDGGKEKSSESFACIFNKNVILNMNLFFMVLDKHGSRARKIAYLVKVHDVQASFEVRAWNSCDGSV